MKRVTNIIGIILTGFVWLLFLILALPFIIIWTPLSYYLHWIQEQKFKKYLIKLGNKNFFCYNNKKGTRDFIERDLIPKLDSHIELIFLDGREPKSKYVTHHISTALYKSKNFAKFPHLLKVRDGKMIDASINNEFFNTINQNKSLENLLRSIHTFFELEPEK